MPGRRHHPGPASAALFCSALAALSPFIARMRTWRASRSRRAPEQFLVPALKLDDIVVADDLGSHKGKAMRKAIKSAGARLLFQPKYSPDLNPIEQVFAKLKAFVRKATPRTFDALAECFPTNAPPTSAMPAMPT